MIESLQGRPLSAVATRFRFLFGHVPICKTTGLDLLKFFFTYEKCLLKGSGITTIFFSSQPVLLIISLRVASEMVVIIRLYFTGHSNHNFLKSQRLNGDGFCKKTQS